MAKEKTTSPHIDIEILDQTVIKGVKLILSAADRTIQPGSEGVEFQESVETDGLDDLGHYQATKHSYAEKYTDRRGRVWDKSTASLETRVYPAQRLAVVHTSCLVDWGEMIASGSVRIEFDSIPGLKNLLALYMFSDWWSRPHFDTDLSKLPMRVQMLLWENDEGEYGCIVPLVTGTYKCDLNARTGKPGADLSSNEAGRSKCEAVAFVVGMGEDPYELIHRCFSEGMIAVGRPGKMRWEKEYPELFEYIGWCTWDALYQNQNEKDIVSKLKAFKKAKFPMRFLLIDDGWSPVIEGRLTGMDVDRKKFPRGLAPLVTDAREKYGVWWVGVWHTFNAYWGGIEKGSEIYCKTKEHLFENKRGMVIPYPDTAKGFGFWNAWHNYLRSQGISFVKVDNQGSIANNTKHSMPIGEAARGEQYSLQASVDLNMSGWIINCMCMTNECAWNWINSNVSRNSDDFFPKNPESAPEHARQNCYNNLMYSNLNWPDWDMWWSDHPRAQYHAAMRAISGGPVYVSDPIDTSNFDVLWPLVFSDGKLLRCDEPALPTRDSLFIDPKENPVALKVFNTVGEAGIIGAFNATDGDKKAKGSIKPSDVEHMHAEHFAVREFFSGETRVLGINDTWDFELEPYGQKLFSVVPIVEGAAVLGLADKYISPAAILAEFRNGNSLAIDLYEGGEFMAYCENKPKSVTVNGKKMKFDYADGWLSLKCKGGEPAVVVMTL